MVETAENTTAARRLRSPLLWVGILGIVVCEALLFADVWGHHSLATRLARANVTPICWLFYLLLLLGLLSGMDGRSWLWRFRNRFAVCWLWSVPAWCYFDWMKILSKWSAPGTPTSTGRTLRPSPRAAPDSTITHVTTDGSSTSLWASLDREMST